MHPIIRPLALAVLLCAGTGHALAQDLSLNWNPRTGDVWVDTQLSDINRYGTQYRDPFIDEMVRYHGAPRALVTELLVDRRWAPGDVYYACALARAAGRQCAVVVDEWERNQGQGWGAVAQRMGIKPGSAEFHALKKGFVPTYDRWGRPISLDADLQQAYPNRGKARATAKGTPAAVQAKPARPGAEAAKAAKPAKGGKPANGKPANKGKGKPGDPDQEKAGPDRGSAARGAQSHARDKANAKPR